MEGREIGCFPNGNDRRDVVKTLRIASQKALENASPELLADHQKAQLWGTLSQAKSWMDIQNTIQSMATAVKTFKGENGEPFLFALAYERPEFMPNLMRMKAASDEWWLMKDSYGANLLHYLACSTKTSSYEYRKESQEKIRKLLDEHGPSAPKTKEDWVDWHQVLWASNLKNVGRDSSDPDPEGNRYGSELGWHNVKWFQRPWDEKDGGDPAFGRIDQSGLLEFRKSLNSNESFETFADTWLSLALETGSVPDTFNPNSVTERDAQKTCPNLDIKRLSGIQAHTFSKDAAQLGLLMAMNQAMIFYVENSWGYDKSNTVADRVKERLDVAKSWIGKGASWKALIEDVESGTCRLHRQWKAKLKAKDALNAVWNNEWSSMLQREELTHRVMPTQKKKAAKTPEQFGLAL